MQNASVKSNTFIDDRTASKMAEGMREATNNLGNCGYGGNQLQITERRDHPRVCERTGRQGHLAVRLNHTLSAPSRTWEGST